MGAPSKQESLSLEYTPTREDLSMYTVKGRDKVRVSSFLAADISAAASDYLVHGNSIISLQKNNSEDVASEYNTWRQWRTWKLARTGLNAVGAPESPWDDDNKSGIANWMDIPGWLLFTSPAKWPDERTMHEFVVAVKDHPEIGALYFYVVVSLKPNQYRVEMSSAKKIRFKQFDELANTRHPWASASGCAADVVDSGWLRVPATMGE